MMRSSLAAIAVSLSLAACSSTSKPSTEQAMIALCSEFVLLKPVLADLIRADAQREGDDIRLEAEDLLAINRANTELNGFCPPPSGFAPLSITLSAAKSALSVLTTYTSEGREP